MVRYKKTWRIGGYGGLWYLYLIDKCIPMVL